MKKIIFLILFVAVFCPFVFADQVTLTTYYPAPFGMYQEMRVMGKLGVATTAPVADLDVNGSIISNGGSGDVNGSGNVNATDAAIINAYATGMTSLTREQAAKADVDGNGIVTKEDAVVAGLIAVGVSKADAKRFVHSITYTTASGSWPGLMNKYFLVDGSLGIGLGTGAASTSYPFQVGVLDTSTAPASTNGIAAAIKNDLWVDGKIYSSGGSGEWTRDAGGFLYPTTATDSVRIGAGQQWARLAVSGGGHFDIRGLNVDLFSLVAGQSTDFNRSILPVGIRGGVYIDVDDGYYGVYQEKGNQNYFKGSIGIGTSAPRARLDVQRLSSQIESRTANLLSVGTYGALSASATAKVYGTLLVGDTSAFGGAIRAYNNIQLVPASGICDATKYGTLNFSWPTGGTSISLRMCAPCYNDPVKCPGWTGGAMWVPIESWKAFSGLNPNPGVQIDPEPPAQD